MRSGRSISALLASLHPPLEDVTGLCVSSFVGVIMFVYHQVCVSSIVRTIYGCV